jgi:hypothetical protein
MKKLLNSLQTFRIGLQMEAEPKSRADKLKRIAKIITKNYNYLKQHQLKKLNPQNYN